MKTKLLLLALLISANAFAQNVNNIHVDGLMKESARKNINVPDILGYKTLKCDFHMHTIFSDGIVWPTLRVDEAYKQGLDVIAITDHIERHPERQHVGGDDNSSYQIALGRAREKNIILIHAAEITRNMPPGHFNALFLNDSQALDKQDWHEAFEEAQKQGAYIIWNHPGWKAQQPDTTMWWNEHAELYNKGMIHAIEVFNEQEWYPIALDWCMDKDLAPHAATDIHGIVSEVYNLDKYNRPMTLVLAEERSEEAVREALFANRTIAYFGHQLAGKEEYLKAFFETSVDIKYYDEVKKGKNYIIKNSSDVPFKVRVKRGPSFTIPANGETIVLLPKKKEWSCEITNLHIGGTKNLDMMIWAE